MLKLRKSRRLVTALLGIMTLMPNNASGQRMAQIQGPKNAIEYVQATQAVESDLMQIVIRDLGQQHELHQEDLLQLKHDLSRLRESYRRTIESIAQGTYAGQGVAAYNTYTGIQEDDGAKVAGSIAAGVTLAGVRALARSKLEVVDELIELVDVLTATNRVDLSTGATTAHIHDWLTYFETTHPQHMQQLLQKVRNKREASELKQLIVQIHEILQEEAVHDLELFVFQLAHEAPNASANREVRLRLLRLNNRPEYSSTYVQRALALRPHQLSTLQPPAGPITQ